MDSANLLGTASYVLLALSYVVTNIIWLRVLAIVALTLEAVYFWWVGEGALWVGIAWVGVFNAINLVQLAILIWSRTKVRISDQEHLLRVAFFGELDKVSLRQLTSRGSFSTVPAGTVVMQQNQPVQVVSFLLSGRVHIFLGTDLVEILRPPGLLGEISFLTGKDSTVGAVTEEECGLFVIEAEALRDLARTCAPIGTVLHRKFAMSLAQTVETADAVLVEQFQPDASQA